jgi:hypothetical protein
MRSRTFFLCVLLLPAITFGQLPSFRCDLIKKTLEDCTLLTGMGPAQNTASGENTTFAANLLDHSAVPVEGSKAAALGATDNDLNASAIILAPKPIQKQGFRWKRALFESFTLLSIEQAYVVHEDYRWVVSENGIPFNHYWRDYKQSLSAQFSSGWNDGDPFLYNYIGHPVQGAVTSYIQIQNDPQGEKLEFSNSKAYWWSRVKATLWDAAYSTQWNIGPLSEVTIEKYGTHTRPPWNHDGTWPCKSKNCFTGVGQVNLVMTPVGGLGWVLAEDLLDKHIGRRVEAATRNRFLIDVARCALNPARSAANILHGKRPWYRASRDAGEMYLSSPKKTAISTGETRAGPQNH